VCEEQLPGGRRVVADVLRATLLLATLLLATAAATAQAAGPPRLTPLGSGPGMQAVEGAVVAGDGTRHLAWMDADDRLVRWDTVRDARTSADRGSAGLSVVGQCLPRDIHGGVILVDCGDVPRLVRVTTLTPLGLRLPDDLGALPHDWERVGATWVAGGRFTCQKPGAGGCPPVYLERRTGEVRVPGQRRTRDLGSPALAAVATCGTRPESGCLPDAAAALRVDRRPAVLARPKQPSRSLPDSYVGVPFFAGGTIAWIGARGAYVRSSRTSRTVRFVLPRLPSGYAWQSVAATRSRVIAAATSSEGTYPSPPVRYYGARVPASTF